MAELSKDKVGELFEKFIKNAEEERDLALERYRRQDILIETSEDFVLQGKNAVDFLKTAAQRSDAILDAAKVMSSILYKDASAGSGSPGSSGDDLKKYIKDTVDGQLK